jgi:hypothetical protein
VVPHADARAYLAAFVDGELNAGAFVAVGDGVLAFGGYHTTGEVERTGVILHRDGTTSAFSADAALVDASAVSVDSAVWISGRQCDGPAERTDTGITCAPGTLRVIRVDTSTMAVENIATGPPKSDETGSDLLAELFRREDEVVLQVTTSTGRHLSTLSVSGQPRAVPAGPGPVKCSTGNGLVAERGLPTQRPSGRIGSGETPAPVEDPGVAFLPGKGADWRGIPPPPANKGAGDRACSSGWVLILPPTTDGRHVAMQDARTREWRDSPDMEFQNTPYTITNPDTPLFVISDGNNYFRIDPRRGTLEDLKVPPDPLEGGPTWVLTSRGDLATIGPDLSLQLVR